MSIHRVSPLTLKLVLPYSKFTGLSNAFHDPFAILRVDCYQMCLKRWKFYFRCARAKRLVRRVENLPDAQFLQDEQEWCTASESDDGFDQK